MKKLLPQTSKGFTLVELLVVVSILAILAVMAVTVLSGVQKQARDSRRKADIDAIASALEAKYNNGYTDITNAEFAGGAIPTDPGTYSYTRTVTGTTSYCTCAQMENGGGNSVAACGGTGTTYYCKKNQQ